MSDKYAFRDLHLKLKVNTKKKNTKKNTHTQEKYTLRFAET